MKLVFPACNGIFCLFLLNGMLYFKHEGTEKNFFLKIYQFLLVVVIGELCRFLNYK